MRVTSGKFKRLTLVMFIPLIIAGFLTAKYLLKPSHPSMRCANFATGYNCESMDFESGRKIFFDSGEVFSGWFSVNFESLDEKYNEFGTDVKSTPLFMKTVLVEGIGDGLVPEQEVPKFLRDILGKAVAVRLGSPEDDFPSGVYKDGNFLSCFRVNLRDDFSIFEALCKINEAYYRLNLSPIEDSYDQFNDFKKVITDKFDELHNNKRIDYISITFSYLILYFLISAILFFMYKAGRYVIYGAKK